jgi:hypothetical protein
MKPQTMLAGNGRDAEVLVAIATILLFVAVISGTGGCAPGEESTPSEPASANHIAPHTGNESRLNETPRMVPPSLPSLADCTRIEVTYYPSTLCALGLAYSRSILSSDEVQYLESIKTIVIDDPNRIKAFGQALRCGSYEGSGYGLAERRAADVVCYRGQERLISFEKYPSEICTQDGHWFQYRPGTLSTIDLLPEVYPLYLRGRCATNLYCLGVELRTMSREGAAWPAPDKWCDVLPFWRVASNPGAPGSIARQLVCPSAGEGKCHYAMNSACRADSPADMVLLFETKAGWNQHGGAELFTFDHHNPKGGLVLLNDGTVKFIRTEEELKQLRWR